MMKSKSRTDYYLDLVGTYVVAGVIWLLIVLGFAIAIPILAVVEGIRWIARRLSQKDDSSRDTTPLYRLDAIFIAARDLFTDRVLGLFSRTIASPSAQFQASGILLLFFPSFLVPYIIGVAPFGAQMLF